VFDEFRSQLRISDIAVAVSGTKRETLRASAFLWSKGQDDYTELLKARDIILEPKN